MGHQCGAPTWLVQKPRFSAIPNPRITLCPCLLANRSLGAVVLALDLTSTFAFELSTIFPALCALAMDGVILK
jgi:hypothetical protein